MTDCAPRTRNDLAMQLQYPGEESRMVFRDRQEAGQKLATSLRQYQHNDVVVLGLPRGGVVVAAEVARELCAPLGLALVRKIGHPYDPEYAIGALAENDEPIYNEHELEPLSDDWRTHAEAAARELIAQRRAYYYGNDFMPPTIANRTAIIVDDGIATGLTMEAAVQFVKHQSPAIVIVAAPVASGQSIDRLSDLADTVVVLENPANFLGAIGAHYNHFEQIDDREVRGILQSYEKY